MKDNTQFIFNYLQELYKDASCELQYNSSYELLVAVILSAQCTDRRVNIITPELFKKYPTPKLLASANLEELEKLIWSCGLYKSKAKNLISCANSLMDNFNGEVPNNLKDLVTLAGVGRKTANVVYSVAFGGQAIAVDTHVLRVSNRLGLANSNNPTVVEKTLMQLFDKNDWTKLHYMLVLFGRYNCTAKKPKCEHCKLKNICIYYKKM
ncbi:MAG: endonuclease III [Clostridia bacterium]|nr:endonuclease III [Clostridia bacterium]